LVRITEILTDGKAPTLTKSVRRDNPKPARVEAAAAGEEEAAPAKPKSKAAKKPAAKSKGAKSKSAEKK
jgi:large subunit ribosomal protein L21